MDKNNLSKNLSDKINLERFVEAQKNTYAAALAEIKSGKKTGHWMWFIFPQLKGLGRSEAAQYYGISDLAEAQAYLLHPVLGARLIEISSALLMAESNNAEVILGDIDSLRLKSCMTLFLLADPEIKVFEGVLYKFFKGEEDEITNRLLR